MAYMKSKTHFFKHLDLTTVLSPAKEGSFSGTKVAATIGPAIQDVATLTEVLKAGVTSARVDLTWGPIEFHQKSLRNLQTAVKDARKICSVIVDTLGRELMIRRPVFLDEQMWPTHDRVITVKAGNTVTLTTRTGVEASDDVLPITYDKFHDMAEVGDTIYIGRYLVCGADSASLYLEVVRKEGTEVVCEAKNDATLDGLLTVFHVERSSDTLSNKQNDLPLLSHYDRTCLQQLAAEFEIDFISLSYTRTAQDVLEARQFLDSIGLNNTKILAKIESRQALLNFMGILEEADGVIISRGNLGLDCLPEKMALVQKHLVSSCNLLGKPVLITRVVDTMTNTPRPTRAEATDIANAVLDGVDGILLGAETLRGRYPLETVRTITSICQMAEEVFDSHHHYDHLMEAAMRSDRRSTTVDDFEPSEARAMGRDPSHPALNRAIKAMTSFAGRSSTDLTSINSSSNLSGANAAAAMENDAAILMGESAYLSKLESIASSAVRAADKVCASLVIVYTHTGMTAQLVAKYRPPMPILTLVVPHLVADGLKWKLEGRSVARQCQLTRGILPVLAAPNHGGSETMLSESVAAAAQMGLVQPHDHIVVVQRIHEDFCVKIVSVDELGSGIKRVDPEHVF